MKGLSKQIINQAFTQSILDICKSNRIPPIQMTIVIRIFEKGRTLILLCRNNIVQKEMVSFAEFLTRRLIGIRFSPSVIEKLFRIVHNAFLKETKTDDPSHISLVYYFSLKAGCPCVGILQDEKPLKSLTLSDVIEATELESEQLN